MILILNSCTVNKSNQVSNVSRAESNIKKLPIYLKIYPPIPNDSLIDFIKPYWDTKLIRTVTHDEQIKLGQNEIARVSSSTLCPPFEQPQERVDYIFANTSFVVNNLGLKFFVKNNNIDSLQWSIYYLPANSKNIRKTERHTFIPTQNKDFYTAFKEFTDTLLTSKDYL